MHRRLRLLGLILVLAAPGLAAAGQSSGQTSTAPRPPAQTPPSLPGSAVPGSAQPGTTGTGAISGVVLDATTRAPVPDTLVYLSTSFRGRGLIGPQSRQLTDTKGRFAFINLPPGTTYTLSTSKFGYLDGGFVADGAPGASLGFVVVKDGEWVQNVNISMWRPGAVSGVVADEEGDPVVGVLVRVLPRFRIQGRDELAAGPVTMTDDRGAYRISGLGPGRYVVQVPSVQASIPIATPLVAGRNGAVDAAIDLDAGTRLVVSKYPLPPPPANGRSLAYPPTFYPGTSAAAQAVVIDLKYGEDRGGLDLRLEPVTTATVSGVVQGPADAVASVMLRLMPAGLENLGQGSEAATAVVDADGRFTFLNVPAGPYTIDAARSINEFTTAPYSPPFGPGGPSFPAPPGRSGSGRTTRGVDSAPPGTSFSASTFGGAQTTYTGRAALVVGGANVTNVVVNLHPSSVMGGRFVLEADPNLPAPAATLRLPVLLDPAGGSPALGMPQSSFQPDGPFDEFEVTGLLPGEYWLRLQVPGWLIKSIQWKGKDYTTTPFDAAASSEINGVVVTITNAVPTLSGAVHDRDGLPSAGTTVLVFPSDHGQWTNVGLVPSRLKSIATTNTGTFSLTTLPAGEYLAVAVSSAPTGWRDPEVLARLESGATRVTLSWGAQANVDLTVRTTPGVVSR